MRYIKLFEDLNTDGYESIDDFWDSDIKNFKFNRITFNQKEIDKLTLMGFSIILLKKRAIFDSSTLHGDISIYKSDDEWYYVCFIGFSQDGYITNLYYKCDQWDGLMSLLKKEYRFTEPTEKKKGFMCKGS